ncbi:MAG TPA: LuxR C-terminal-related transcriptional regulator [Solirubrobacteraceae bacterium]|nr:LuxR C-terminal-related transcriptional regulator [Solirubrobacteraceae bacterium]
MRSAVMSMRYARGRARQFWHVFDRSLVPMLIVDNERRYLAANAAARLMFRMTLAELRSRRIDDLTPPHMLARLHERWARLMRYGSVSGPYDVGLPDGTQLEVIYCASANALPGQHLIVFVPATWPGDELEVLDEHRPPHSRPTSLSPREQEVLSLIAAGFRLQQIADELIISVNTVRTHTRNALRKLGAHNRAHAIALAMQRGLIDLPSS